MQQVTPFLKAQHSSYVSKALNYISKSCNYVSKINNCCKLKFLKITLTTLNIGFHSLVKNRQLNFVTKSSHRKNIPVA